MSKSSLEALQEAVRLEKEGREYYLAAAGKAKNEATRKLFEYIAEEEVRHIKVINQIHNRMKEISRILCRRRCRLSMFKDCKMLYWHPNSEVRSVLLLR